MKETANRVYYVGVGGSPRDSWIEYDDFSDAQMAALEMAEQMAEEQGIDPAKIDTWGDDDPEIGAGACPEGDPGGYWPMVVIKEMSQ